MLMATTVFWCLFQLLGSGELRFTVTTKDVMVWKPSNIQLRNVKQKNGASYFSAALVKESPVIQQAGLTSKPPSTFEDNLTFEKIKPTALLNSFRFSSWTITTL